MSSLQRARSFSSALLLPMALTMAGCAGDAINDPDAGGSDESGESAMKPESVRSTLSRDIEPVVSAETEEELAAGSTAFGQEFFAQVAEDGQNKVFSPYSLRSALAMTYAAASGTTAEEMAGVLHFDLPQDELHAAFNAANLSVDGVEDFELNIANAVWGQTGGEVQSNYLDLLAVNYGAGLQLLDFASDPEGAAKAINWWVEQETSGRIPEVLGVEDVMGAAFVLTNAIYFNADWKRPFDKESTDIGTFTRLDDVAVQTSFMNQTGAFEYAAGEGWQYLELPYVGGRVSMGILLPESGSFSTVEAQFEQGVLDEAMAATSSERVRLRLPKWDFETKVKLRSTLEAMGMPTAFSNAAEFDIIVDFPTKIDEVIHEANITVDEEGTTAAAATAVVMVGTVSSPSPEEDPIFFTADQPFVFFIRDAVTGLTLFQGRVADPTAAD